jgi:hypothetical protein
MDAWEVFTRSIATEVSAEVRWFWRRYGVDGSMLVSSDGFHCRAECQADAAKNGCKGELELPLRPVFLPQRSGLR